MLNRAQIIGRVGRDPEVRYTADGEPVANLSIATSEQWADPSNGQRREATEWHRVSLFGRLAEIAGQYLRKGALVYVEGRIRTRKFPDSTGIERYVTEIRGNALRMLGRPPGQNTETDAEPSARQPSPVGRSSTARPPSEPFDDMDDDIPF